MRVANEEEVRGKGAKKIMACVLHSGRERELTRKLRHQKVMRRPREFKFMLIERLQELTAQRKKEASAYISVSGANMKREKV